jgi:hypothetical protein
MRIGTARSVDELLGVVNARHGPGGHWHSRASEEDPDHDHLSRPGDAVRFLADHGVPTPASRPPARVLDDLRLLAREMRALAAGPGIAWPTPALARRLRLGTYRIGPDAVLRSAAPDAWDRLVDDLTATALAVGERSDDLRACDNPLCRFVFLDNSRNRSRRWCDMTACGNRAKLRRFRGRGGASRQGDQPSGRMSGLSTTQATTTATRSPSSRSMGRRSGR